MAAREMASSLQRLYWYLSRRVVDSLLFLNYTLAQLVYIFCPHLAVLASWSYHYISLPLNQRNDSTKKLISYKLYRYLHINLQGVRWILCSQRLKTNDTVSFRVCFTFVYNTLNGSVFVKRLVYSQS